MRRWTPRLVVALAAAVLAATALAACGGGDDSGSTTASTPTETTSQGKDAQPKTQGGDSGGKQHEAGGSGQSKSSESGSGSSTEVAPLQVSGGGSGQFRSHGGDNSIQDFGEEGDESELEEAAATVHAFYVARAKEEWTTACSYLGEGIRKQLEQLSAQASQIKGKGCAPALQAFTRPLPPSVDREATTVDAGSLRHEGEQAFLIYYGPDKSVYAMSLSQEDGEWKVGALAGTPLG